MNFGGVNITSTNPPQIETDPGVQNLVAIELASGASAFNSFLFELTQTGEKQVNSQTKAATQEKLKLKNEATKVAQLYVPNITKYYPPVIEALKKEFITPYEEVRNLLNGKEVSLERGTKYPIYIIVRLESQEVIDELKKKLSGSLKRLGPLKGTGYKFFNEDGNLSIPSFLVFLEKFDLWVDVPNQSSTKGKIVKDTKDEIEDLELTKTIKDLESQLTTIGQQVNDIVVRSGTGEPDRNNTKVLTYLGENAYRAKEVVLDALFDGFYNAKDKKFPSKAKIIDYLIGTPIVREWLKGER